ncbi:MAG: hypothetical protein ACAH12_01540 [Methylophilaceae bacterium]
MLRLFSVILLVVLSSYALSSLAETQKFTVVGNGVIFALADPAGWEMDTNSQQNNKLPVVYYPTGQTWGNAHAVIYANSSMNDCHTSLEKYIAEDIADFKNNSPNIVIKDGGALTIDGKKIIIKMFTGDHFGNIEAVAYVDNKDGPFITITLTSRTQQLFDEALPIFKELVSSFQLVGNSMTCNSKGLTFSERVELAKRAEEQKEISNYIYKQMFPAIGSNVASLMKSCLAKKTASVDKFTIVADINPIGKFREIEFLPKTNTASCFAKGLTKMSLPPTNLCQCGQIPFVLDMGIKP